MSFKEGKKKSVSFAVLKEDGEKAARRFGLAAWSKCALWQVPCASSGRARWLWAARHFGGARASRLQSRQFHRL